MPYCFFPCCDHSDKTSKCKWLRFPRNDAKKTQWIKAIRREDKVPTDSSLVCSCHFVDGKRENGPTIFLWNAAKRLRYPSPEKLQKKAMVTTVAIKTLSVSEAGPSTSALSEAEIYFLQQENAELRLKLSLAYNSLSFKEIENVDMHVIMYTGFPNKRTFDILFGYLEKLEFGYYLGWNVDKIPKKDQLLMALMKLKLNVPNEDLALRFGCSRTTVRNIFVTWMHVIYEAVYKILQTNMPSRNKNKTCLPSSFTSFTNCRTVLDCTEIYIQIPRALNKQKSTYSNYKHRNTLKGLIGVAPNGVVNYISEMYSGSTSDKKLVAHCGILSNLIEGDMILADKGFLISDILPAGVSLNIPPFLLSAQFTREQIFRTKNIARARIHVERAIRRIKEYRILELIPYNLNEHIDVIWKVCATLTNFNHPLIKEVGSSFNE